MKFGYGTMNSATSIKPTDLARELEGRGFESMWVPEHSHIPVSRESEFPRGGELPESYSNCMHPFATLAAAGAVTSKIKLGTAVFLPLEHNLINLAVETATVDAMTGGRLLLGTGVGWNAEELADHRPDLPFKKRYSAFRERIAALRALWGEDPASFEGQWDRVKPSIVQPKPRAGHIPILMGGWAPLGMRHAAEYADGWFPSDFGLEQAHGDVPTGIANFRSLVEECGRDPLSVPITLLHVDHPTPKTMELYQELGIERLLIAENTFERQSPEDTLRDLDIVTPLVEPFKEQS